MANPSRSRSRPARPPATLVLLVRHGTTPSTGQVLPGRAPGLHLADRGRAQAEALAARVAAWAGIGAPPTNGSEPAGGGSGAATSGAAAPGAAAPGAGGGPVQGGRVGGSRARRTAPRRLTVAAVFASPLERARETAAPIAAALGQRVQVVRGLSECDFGEWTGRELSTLSKLPEWSTVQRYPSGFRFPGGESFVAMQARMLDTVATLCARHEGQAVVAVSHADPIKAVVADALGTHLDLFQRIVISPCSLTAISYSRTGPIVLAVNQTGALTDLVPS